MEFVRDPGVLIEWASEDRRIIAYPCSDGKLLNICAFMPSNEAKMNTQDGSEYYCDT